MVCQCISSHCNSNISQITWMPSLWLGLGFGVSVIQVLTCRRRTGRASNGRPFRRIRPFRDCIVSGGSCPVWARTLCYRCCVINGPFRFRRMEIEASLASRGNSGSWRERWEWKWTLFRMQTRSGFGLLRKAVWASWWAPGSLHCRWSPKISL